MLNYQRVARNHPFFNGIFHYWPAILGYCHSRKPLYTHWYIKWTYCDIRTILSLSSLLCVQRYITYVRAYLQNYISTYLHTCIPTYLPTYIMTYIHAYITLHYIGLHCFDLLYITLHILHCFSIRLLHTLHCIWSYMYTRISYCTCVDVW